MDIWCFGYSPMNLPILSKMLSVYPDREAADNLYNGFRYGFRINYAGPRVPYESKKLKSVLNNPEIAWNNVMNEVSAGRIAGPFSYRPISNSHKDWRNSLNYKLVVTN